jgi:hypothetical protein
MSLEEFMRRNPSARSKERVKKAQRKQRRASPKMKETDRSRRGGGAVPAGMPKTIIEKKVAEIDPTYDPNKWNTNKIEVAGDQVDFMTPTNPGLGRGPDGGRPPQSYGGPKVTEGMTDEDYEYAYEEGLTKHKNKIRNAQRLFREKNDSFSP